LESTEGKVMRNIVIFCDFDGTITKTDNIISILKKFNPPGWKRLKNQVVNQEVSIRSGVSDMFSLLPSSLKTEIESYILHEIVIRKGFNEFVDFTKQSQIPLYIVSGGMDFFVKPVLAQFISENQIYCNETKFDQENMRVVWPHPCDEHCQNECGCCKPSIMRELSDPNNFNVVIGDSITDLQAAKLADLVIARDFLQQKCKELQIPFKPFETFHDVIDHIRQVKEVSI
jgi:2-hydroxy-3-keto-5-methylthiopentenyl-1-phosphate phosphatase